MSQERHKIPWPAAAVSLRPREDINPRSNRRLIVGILFMLTAAIAGLNIVSRTIARPNHLAAQSPSRFGSSGAIPGRVFTDTGLPLSYVTVQCQGLGLSRDQNREVHTDEDGRFQIGGLSSGVYRLTAWAPGYAPLQEESMEGEDRLYRPGDQAILLMRKGGVITGTVTGTGGEPAVAARVKTIFVGETVIPMFGTVRSFGHAVTDDRGIYRIFGLYPGRYLVCAGGDNLPGRGLLSVYDQVTISYFVSSSSGVPSEVEILGSEEASGINIQLSNQVGHNIQGAVSIGSGSGFDAALNPVILAHAPEGAFQESIQLGRQGDSSMFSFEKVLDGDYFVLAASLAFPSDRRAVSMPVRVQVRGNDVTGIGLKLRPLQTVSGVISLASGHYTPSAGCKQVTPPKLEETVVRAFRVSSKETDSDLDQFLPDSGETTPNGRGEFSLNNLSPGRYFLDVRFGTDPVYIRSIQLQSSSSGVPPVDAARSGLAVGQGEPLSRLTIEAAHGAAQLSGRIVPVDPANGLPSRLKIYLVPSESNEKNNPLRFSEAAVGEDGHFHLEHLAPGGYRILARREVKTSNGPKSASSLIWNSNVREKLSAEAELASTPVDLQPCQELTGLILQFPTASEAR